MTPAPDPRHLAPISLRQTTHFFDIGYGWLCKHCSAADSERTHQPSETRSGFFRPAEPEKKEAKPPGLPLASWTDSSRHVLNCPRCGIEETVLNSNQNRQR
jgi:rubredoxin